MNERMNSRTRRHYLPLLALAATVLGCSVTEHREDTIVRNWPAAEIRTLEIDEVDGSVEIEASDVDEIALVAKVRVRGDMKPKADQENKGYFKTSLNGDTLRISRRARRQRWFFHRDHIAVQYELRVPARIALEVRTVNGRIATRGTDGESELETVNGTIDVEASGNNEIYARTVNGRVRARFVSNFQGARFRTVNGGVEAILPDNASFSVDLSQVNGDFEASFPLSIHSNPGSRRVSGEVNGGRHELTIVTVNGDVELEQSGSNIPSAPNTPALPQSPVAPPDGSVPPAPPAPPAPSAPTT